MSPLRNKCPHSAHRLQFFLVGAVLVVLPFTGSSAFLVPSMSCSSKVFIKLGGSCLTDKEQSCEEGGIVRPNVLGRVAEEIAAAYKIRGDLPLHLVVGHGSGNFGHQLASKHGTRDGVSTALEWGAFAQIAANQRMLNLEVTNALLRASIPAISFSPSSSLVCQDGTLHEISTGPILSALATGCLVPIVHGDVVFDSERGGTIASTEEVFQKLAKHPELKPRHIIMAGDTDGVYNQEGQRVPRITPQNLQSVTSAITGSKGVDVTGGMSAKVNQMLELATSSNAPLTVRLVNGLAPGMIQRAIESSISMAGNEDISFGTLICSS